MNICVDYPVRSRTADQPTTRRRWISSRRAPSNSFRVEGLTRDIRIKIATERREFEAAHELVASNYRARGYEADGGKPYRFTSHHALPGTVTMVALHEDQVVATLSLVPDTSLLGLPLESIYAPEVEELRRRGRRMAEAIGLADRGLSIREFVLVFKALIKLAMQYHRSQGGDSWVIVVHPRHRGFYQRVLGFTPLGPQRSYPSVQNHPGEAYLLDVELMATNNPEMYREIFEEDLPRAVLDAHRWSPARVRHFGARSSHLDEAAVEELLATMQTSKAEPCWV